MDTTIVSEKQIKAQELATGQIITTINALKEATISLTGIDWPDRIDDTRHV